MDLEQLDDALSGQDVTATEAVAALGVFVLGVLVALVLGKAVRAAIGRPDDRSQQLAKLAARLVRWLVYVVAASWSLSIVGIGVGWVTTTLAVLVLGAVLAARPLVENLAAGAALVSRPAFGIGDDVEIGGHQGRVIEFTSRSTVLRLRDGRRVHLPNVEVVQEVVTVFTVEHARRSELEVEVAWDTDVDRAAEVLRRAAAGAASVVADPAPNVRARALGDGVRLSLRFWHAPSIQAGNQALDEVVRAVKRALDGAGVVPARPSLAVHPDGTLRGGPPGVAADDAAPPTDV